MLGFECGIGNRTAIEVVSREGDRSLQFTFLKQFIDRQGEHATLTEAKEADARWKPLVWQLSPRPRDPALNYGTVRKLAENQVIEAFLVVRIARDASPTKWTTAFEKHRPDVAGDTA